MTPRSYQGLEAQPILRVSAVLLLIAMSPVVAQGADLILSGDGAFRLLVTIAADERQPVDHGERPAG